MRKLAAISFGALAIAGAAGPASAEGFQGFFAGVQIGDTFGDADSAQSATNGGALSLPRGDYKLSALQGGVHAGYNHQSNNFVFGGIVDYNFIDVSGSDNGTGGSDDRNTLNLDSIVTLRARGGWLAWQSTLLYATAGWAWMEGDSSIDFTVAATSTAESHGVDFSGFTYGLGATFMTGDRTTMGFEWRHYSLDEERVSFRAALNGYDIGIEPDLDTIELTFSYHFAGMMN
ncbi:MAG: outer membrane beta-barrel protein [Alphaproteobacteria bacterium]|nr:outer membrane beta-barrel protein [Alphaproteobacteria bacterium]